MRVIVDDALCTGHARCYNACDAFFQVDDEGYAVLRGRGAADVPTDLESQVRRAVALCPEHAITTTET